jgi:hypothetical protein
MKNPIALQELKEFIYEASKGTYASGNESIKQIQSDKSTVITYSRGKYSYHDNYFGGEPYGGREVVFIDNQPVWMMVYYGFVYHDQVDKDVYSFLVESLSRATLNDPYRGPVLYEKDNWRYENKVEGTLENFSGMEKIYKDTICIYQARYIGGLVDR